MEVLGASEVLQAPADAELSAQPENIGSDHAVPVPDNVLARPIEDRTAARPEEDLVQAVADNILPPTPPSADSAMDQLTADLAAFCFDQLERTLTVSNEAYEVGGSNEFEDELRVRFKLQRIYKIPINDSFR